MKSTKPRQNNARLMLCLSNKSKWKWLDKQENRCCYMKLRNTRSLKIVGRERLKKKNEKYKKLAKLLRQKQLNKHPKYTKEEEQINNLLSLILLHK